MKKSFFRTFIVLFFSFVLSCSVFVHVASAANSIFQNMTPEQRVSTINSNPNLYLDKSTQSNWNLMTEAQQVNVMKTTPGSFLATEYEIRAESMAASNPIEAIKNAVTNPVVTLISSIAWIVTSTFNLILGWSGQIFDLVMNMTVYDYGLFRMVEPSISDAWKIVRDLANIVIVFSMLYLAIKTILDGNGFADKKILAGVILAAILINFSLFFTTIAFNVSNFVAQNIAQQIAYDGATPGATSISGNIQRMVGTKDLIDKLVTQPSSEPVMTALGDLRSAIIASMTALVMTIILFVASLMLLYRFLVFIFLMISSPVGLISYFIPWFEGAGKMWRDNLKQQFLFLPVFMITMYVALLFIGNITSNINPQTPVMTFFFYFIITCGFLLAILIIPGKVAGGGANMMSNIGDWSKKQVRSLPKRTAQFGANTALRGVARSSQYGANLVTKKILNSEKLKAAAQNPDSNKGKFARVLMRNADGLKNRTFDLRNSNLIPTSWGLGKGVNNWNDSVEAKKKVLQAREDKEKKLYGYDQQAKTEENKNAIVTAEAVRDAQGAVAKKAGEDVKTAQVAYTQAIAVGSTATDAEKAKAKEKMEKARSEFEKQTKALEKEEMKVGELKNKGDSDYLKLVQSRNKRMWNKMSLTQRAAVEKMEKDMKERWLKEGKFKAPKTPKNNSAAPTVNVNMSGIRPPTSATGNMGGSTSTMRGTVNFGNGGGTAGSTATGTGNGTI